MIESETVRGYFADELSCRIFDWRMRISQGVKTEYPEMLDYMDLRPQSKDSLQKRIEHLRDERVEKYIYGAGRGCFYTLYSDVSTKHLRIKNIKGIIDKQVLSERYGLPVITFEEFAAKHRDALVFNSIGSVSGMEVHRKCEENGIEIVSLFEIVAIWDQYFDLPAKLGFNGENAVFVQAGCFNGDTEKSYINWFGAGYSKLITFEPNAKQYSLSKKMLAGMRCVELVQTGLSNHTGRVRFETEHIKDPGASYISEQGGDEIPVVALDLYMNGGKVSFIALDIEGGEYNALLGAEQIIRAQKPKLAICVYHKPEDILELPALVKQFRPDYKLYLRHYYALGADETVLYAV